MAIYYRKNSRLLILSAIFFTFLLFGSCGNNKKAELSLTPQERVALLISRSLEKTGTLVSPSRVNNDFFKKHKIPSPLQKQFKKTYEWVRVQQSKVFDDYRNERKVPYFILLRFLYYMQDTGYSSMEISNKAVSENPIYMAFSLLMEGMPDFALIDSRKYIEQLAKSFGVKERHIIEGIWHYLQNNEYNICRSVALMINDNVNSKNVNDPGFFFQNILIPFLTYTSKGLVIHPHIEKLVFSNFNESFKVSKKESLKNTLYDFTVAFRKYLLGNSFHVRFQKNLNSILKKCGYRILVMEKTCIGYRILDYTVHIRREGIEDVIFLKKISVSLSMNYLGFSISSENDVVLVLDNIINSSDDIKYTIETGKPLQSYCNSEIAGHWNSLGTGLDLNYTDEIYVKLIKKEFQGESQKSIINKLIKEITVHELKHKWDEKERKGNPWYNIDSETSAHITEIIYGGIPYYSLLSFVNRYHRFFNDNEIKEVRDKLQPVIVQCWNIAKQISDESIGIERIKKDFTEIYNKYELLNDNGHLTDLNRYAEEIVIPCLQSLPEFDVSKILTPEEYETWQENYKTVKVSLTYNKRVSGSIFMKKVK